MQATATAEPNSKSEASVESARFVRDVHEIVRDLLEPSPTVFWADFLITISIVYATLWVYLTADNFSALQIGAGLVCSFAMYRATVFTHELEHRREGTFGAFRFVWNALCGIPFFMPSFLYDDHQGHHSNHSYGTDHDPEYLSLSKRRTRRAVLFLLVSVIYPVLGLLRFLVFTPIALIPGCDRWVFQYVSSLYMLNPKYHREYDETAHSVGRWTQEILCCVFAWGLVAAVVVGLVPASVLLKLYLVFFVWICMNQLRTLTAHYYASEGEAFDYAEQVLDSHTFERGLLPELWAPLGMRYHALHHVMPAMPYHAMGEAHRRLMQRLPPNSPYRRTLQPGLPTAVREAFFGRRARRAEVGSSAR